MLSLFLIILFISFTNYVVAQDSLKRVDNIPEVVVTGTRNATEIRHLPLTVSTVQGNQISKRYEQSLLPILTEQIPGLFITSRGMMGYGVSTGSSGAMSMRGIGGNPTTGMLVLIDGHPQYMGLMGHPIADAYQSLLASKVEVVRGPASVLYGSNAMGGVINIITVKQQIDKIGGNARIAYGSYNTLNSDASFKIKKRKLAALITGSYNRTDGSRENMDFEQYGGYAKIGYEFTENWNAFADINITHFNAKNPGAINKPIYDNISHITRGMASLSVENTYKNTSGAIKLFYNWGKHKINDGYYEGEKPKDFLFVSKDKMFGVTLYQSASFWNGNVITAGVEYQLFGGKAWNNFFSGNDKQIVDKTLHNIAGYIDFRQSLSNIITINAGLRIDNNSNTGTHFIPQIGVSIYPLEKGEIKAIASRGFRNPTIREMYMFPPQNPNLKPEQLWNYEISWSHRILNSKLMYGVNLYYINGKDMIQVVPINGKPMNINTGKVKNMGIELNTSYKISNSFNIMANYSYIKMKYKILATPKNKLYVGLDFNKDRWSAATGIQYVTGLYTSLKPEVKENYILWNIRGSYNITKWLNIYVKGENLLNRHYEINLGFPMPGTNIMGGININI